MSILKNQRRGLGAALAAWGAFLLLAGGLAGYVVGFSETPLPQQTQEEAAAEPSDDGEADRQAEELPAATPPSLAAHDDEAAPDRPTEAAETTAPDREPAAEDAAQPADDQAVATAPEATRPSTDEDAAPAGSAADEAVRPVADTKKVNGHTAPSPVETAGAARPSDDEAEATAATEKPETPQETAPAAVSEDAAAENDEEGEVQQAMLAPPPVPESAAPKLSKPEDRSPPWQRYAAYFLEEDARPRVAVVMTGLGMSDGITEAAIKSLPPEVTLSFSPYARNLASWIGLARVNGHEVMLDLYMEPSTYPLDDPGPQAIMTVLSEEENRKRFNWVLSRGNSYVGVTGRLGSRLLTRPRTLEPLLRDVADQGLLFVDDRASAGSLGFGMAQEFGIPAAYSEGLIDEPSANRAAIDAKLNRIERIALTKGAAVALAQPYPVTIERLNAWIEELASRGVALAPITAVVDRQPPM